MSCSNRRSQFLYLQCQMSALLSGCLSAHTCRHPLVYVPMVALTPLCHIAMRPAQDGTLGIPIATMQSPSYSLSASQYQCASIYISSCLSIYLSNYVSDYLCIQLHILMVMVLTLVCHIAPGLTWYSIVHKCPYCHNALSVPWGLRASLKLSVFLSIYLSDYVCLSLSIQNLEAKTESLIFEMRTSGKAISNIRFYWLEMSLQYVQIQLLESSTRNHNLKATPCIQESTCTISKRDSNQNKMPLKICRDSRGQSQESNSTRMASPGKSYNTSYTRPSVKHVVCNLTCASVVVCPKGKV